MDRMDSEERIELACEEKAEAMGKDWDSLTREEQMLIFRQACLDDADNQAVRAELYFLG